MAEFTHQFVEDDNTVIVILINSELSRFTRIMKRRDGDQYSVNINYGDLGKGKNRFNTCKLPRIIKTTNHDATSIANSNMTDKLSHGFVYEAVTVNGEIIYPQQ